MCHCSSRLRKEQGQCRLRRSGSICEVTIYLSLFCIWTDFNGYVWAMYCVLGRQEVEQPEGMRQLGRTRHRWEDNIKLDLQEVWIDLAQDMDRLRVLVNAVMKFWVSRNTGNFLTSWELISFSRSLLLGLWVSVTLETENKKLANVPQRTNLQRSLHCCLQFVELWQHKDHFCLIVSKTARSTDRYCRIKNVFHFKHAWLWWTRTIHLLDQRSYAGKLSCKMHGCVNRC